MTASVQSPEDVINLTLVRIGHPFRVGSLYEGSPASKKALDIYAETRDELLADLAPDFAARDVTLTLLKTAPVGGYLPTQPWTPAFPPPPWIFEYAYPADCLKVRAVRKSPLLIPEFDPQPIIWRLANDLAAPATGRVILCNVAAAILVYTGQVTDMTTWVPSFVEALAAALGRRLSPILAGNPDALKMAAADEGAEGQVAAMAQG